MLKIRLYLKNKKNKIFYIVLIDSKKSRDGIYIEKLGYYNVINNYFLINLKRINHWIKIGVKITLTVKKLINIKLNEFIKKNT